MGLTMAELDELEYGIVIDMITESENDDFEYPYKATQEDFDNFLR